MEEYLDIVDDNNRISDYVLYALGLKDQDELEEFYEKNRTKKSVIGL